MGSQNPLLYSVLKISLSVKARRAGLSRGDIQYSLDALDGATIDAVAASQATPIVYPTIGSGGTILAEIIAFLNSPAGQQLMAALITLLTSLIAGG